MSSTLTIQKLRPYAPYIFFGSLGLGFAWRTIYNSEIANLETNPVVKGAVYKLRHDQEIKRILGDDIGVMQRAATTGWFNMFKGQADVQFKVKGTIGEALVRIKGERTAAKDVWNLSVFEVEPVNTNEPIINYA